MKIDDVIIKGRDEYEQPVIIVVKGSNADIDIQQESRSVNTVLRPHERPHEFTIGRSSMVNIRVHDPLTIEIIKEEVCSFDDVESLL